MPTRCAVCSGLRRHPAEARAETVSLDGKSVTLCRAHAYLVRINETRTIEELRDMFREASGRRSLVARRQRALTPKAADARRNAGRRASDAG